MRMSKLTVSLVAAIGLTVIGGSGALAQAQKTFTLKFNHVLGPKEPYHEGFLKWAKRVEERTKGGLKIEVFHSAQLGREEDIIEQIRQGANIGQNTDSARLGNYVPGIAVMNGPYFAETLEEVAKLRQSRRRSQKWQEELATKYGLKVVCFDWVQGYRHFFTNKPVKTPGRPQGPAHPHAARADLAGIDPRARRDAGRDGLRRDVPGAAAAGDRRRRARLQQHPRRALLRGAEVRQRDEAHHADQLRGGQREVVRQPAEGVPGHPDRGVRQGRRGDLARDLHGSEAEVEQQLKGRGMTIVEDVDLAAFRKAGEKAYEVLKIQDAKAAVHKEIGKN